MFLSSLKFAQDVDGDGTLDFLFPRGGGWAVHRGIKGGLDQEKSAFIPLEPLEPKPFEMRIEELMLPNLVEVDRDGTADLVFVEVHPREPKAVVARGLGAGRFAPTTPLDLSCLGIGAWDKNPSGGGGTVQLGFLGDIDHDGRIEAVTEVWSYQEDQEYLRRYRIHRLQPGSLAFEPRPISQFEATGSFDPTPHPEGSLDTFRDLDGDGKLDLVTVRLAVSKWKAAKAMVTKKITVDLKFQIFAQGADCQVKAVSGQELSEKLKIDLNASKLGWLGQFAGDFNGDHRIDYLRMDGGDEFAVHFGLGGGRFSSHPDAVIKLAQEALDPKFIRVADLDGDGRADLAITHPGEAPEEGVAPPVRLELHLSGGGR